MSNYKKQEFDRLEKIFLSYLDNPNKEDYERLEWDAFNMNDESAFFFLAYILYYAKGVERNVSLAKVYLEESVKKTNMCEGPDERIYKANELLGWIHESGELGNKHFDIAYSLYLEGTKSDNPRFSYERLGFLNYWGYGCKKSYENALNYFDTASMLGSPFADYYLGVMFRDGEGTRKSLENSIRYFKKSAEKGNEDAISCLAFMYSKYYDEWETDFNKSMTYYERLTQMDSPRAQRMGWYGIGYTYLESNDADEYSLAINCLTKAAELGSEQAIELLNSL